VAVKILSLHHHTVYVGERSQDLEAAREFYTHVLGLTVDGSHPPVPDVPGLWLNVGEHSQIRIVAAPRLIGVGQRGRALAHISFDVADIEATRARLVRLGVRIRGRNAGATALFIEDPAGNLICLRQAERPHAVLEVPARTSPATAAVYTRVWGAVMFADMRGFTTISEQLRPADVVPLLNEYFSLLTGIAVHHGGTVLNMAGDGLMVGYGVPHEQADAPERAIDTACEMLSRFRDLAADWRRRIGIETGLGVGVNAGEVIAGNVGSSAYMSYTMVGDTVNVAARLSQRARAGEVLFSGAVKQSLDQHGRSLDTVIPLPALQVRGRMSPVEIYCIPTDERIQLWPQ
jgi:class 3 adenylate cyclase